jgi:uncharacterized protein YhaN
VWNDLRERLPSTFFKNVLENDIRSIYAQMLTLNQTNANAQVNELRAELTSCHKKGRTMREWLDQMYDLIHKLETLREPVQVGTLKAVIRSSLKDDQRYKDVLRDINKNEHWPMDMIRTQLEAAATGLDDLVQTKAADPSLSAKATKLAHKREDDNENAKAKASPPAEKTKKTPEELAVLKKEPCHMFNIGKCKHGDSCHRKHDPELIVSSSPAASAEASTTDVCFSFQANGNCSFADKCKFSHERKSSHEPL